jgi:7-carboxy-7-deazaguanine synthase
MRISEIFYSLQGEGFFAGSPSMFIRLAGCPLRCCWCDTKYARDSEAGHYYSVDKVVEGAEQTDSKFVVITGGEPMLDPDLPELVRQLKILKKHITIETAGITFIPDMPCDLMSISPKLDNSAPFDHEIAERHDNLRLDLAVLGKLVDNYEYQLKFVIDSPDDLPQIQQILEEVGNIDPLKVMLMPQASTRREFLQKAPLVAEMCRKSGFAFGQRLHILLWDGQKGM